jgi:hypothetical protein
MSNDRAPESVMKDPVSWLYPPLEPYNTGRLRVSPVHEIYWAGIVNTRSAQGSERFFLRLKSVDMIEPPG